MWIKTYRIDLSKAERAAFLKHDAMGRITRRRRADIQNEMRYHQTLGGLAYALDAHCHPTEMGHDLPTVRQQAPSPAGRPASPSKAKPRWDGSDQPDRDPYRVADERRLATPTMDKPPPYI